VAWTVALLSPVAVELPRLAISSSNSTVFGMSVTRPKVNSPSASRSRTMSMDTVVPNERIPGMLMLEPGTVSENRLMVFEIELEPMLDVSVLVTSSEDWRF